MIKFTNKKHLFFTFFFITGMCINAQDYEKIKSQNTVFIHFKNQNEVELKTALGSYETNPDRKPYLYQFFKLNNEGEKDMTPLITLHFRVIKNVIRKEELILYRVNKSFLRKNKDIIIDWRFIEKIGSQKILKILNNAKTIFLIDNSEIKNKQILIKQVLFSNIANQ